MDIIGDNADEEENEISSCSSSEEGNVPQISVSTPTSIPGRPSSLNQSNNYLNGKYIKVTQKSLSGYKGMVID